MQVAFTAPAVLRGRAFPSPSPARGPLLRGLAALPGAWPSRIVSLPFLLPLLPSWRCFQPGKRVHPTRLSPTPELQSRFRLCFSDCFSRPVRRRDGLPWDLERVQAGKHTFLPSAGRPGWGGGELPGIACAFSRRPPSSVGVQGPPPPPPQHDSCRGESFGCGGRNRVPTRAPLRCSPGRPGCAPGTAGERGHVLPRAWQGAISHQRAAPAAFFSFLHSGKEPF